MSPHLTLPQIMWLLGTATVVGVLLVVVAYAFHRAVHHALRQEEPRPAGSRVSGDAPLIVATLQGVITNLKEQQRKADDIHRATEQRAAETAQLLEAVAQEMEEGLIVFSRDGSIRLANPAARKLLELDAESRRRYLELFGPESEVAARIQACLEGEKVRRDARVEFRAAGGEVRVLSVSVAPFRGPNGETAGAMCLLRPWPPESGN